MKRFLAGALLALMLMTVAGCAAPAAKTPAATPGATEAPGTPGTKTASTDPYAAIPVDGAHEKAAIAALPAALKTASDSARSMKKELTDVTGATATLVSYDLQARVGDSTVLFEVRADGRAYEIYKYPVAPVPAKLFWQPAEYSSGAFVAEPAGDGELAAASAVAAVVKAAKPGKASKVKISGYTFFWIKADGKPVTAPGGAPFSVMIDPKGNAASWSL